MHDEAVLVRQWRASGDRVAFARVVNRVGLSPDLDLDLQAYSAGGDSSGRLLAGAADERTTSALRKALDQPAGSPAAIVTVQVDAEQAADAGLSEAGTAYLLVQTTDAVPDEFWDAMVARHPVVLATGIGGPVAEAGSLVVVAGQDPVGSLDRDNINEGASAMALKMLAAGVKASAMLDTDRGTVLVEAFVSPPHVVVAGEGDVANAIVAQAHLLGWMGRVASDAGALDEALAWSAEAGAVVVHSHDDIFGTDALYAALRSGAFYIGAMGSRRILSDRAGRLTWLGLGPEEIQRIHGPVGLDLGGRAPAEMALAICAEILASRTGREPMKPRATDDSMRQRAPAAP